MWEPLRQPQWHDVYVQVGEGRRQRSVGQWLVSGFVVSLGVGVWIAAAVQLHAAVTLRAHALSAMATVDQVRRQGRDNTYLIDFTLTNGTHYEMWTDRVDQHTASGDSVTVLYKPGAPGTAEDERILGRWWLAPTVLGPLGALFLVGGWLLWRAETDRTTRDILRSSYIRWRD